MTNHRNRLWKTSTLVLITMFFMNFNSSKIEASGAPIPVPVPAITCNGVYTALLANAADPAWGQISTHLHNVGAAGTPAFISVNGAIAINSAATLRTYLAGLACNAGAGVRSLVVETCNVP
jgi:hypothetical protein